MKTFDIRLAMVNDLLNDADLKLSPKEVFSYVYHWMCYERALQMELKANQIRIKHAKWLNNTTDIYRLRKEMSEL